MYPLYYYILSLYTEDGSRDVVLDTPYLDLLLPYQEAHLVTYRPF